MSKAVLLKEISMKKVFKAVKNCVIAVVLLLASFCTYAGSNSSPGLYYGQVPTAGQWNTYFSNKLDYLPGVVNTVPYWDAGGNFLNTLISGDCTSVANVFSCAHVGSVLAGPGTFTTITGSTSYALGSKITASATAPVIASGFGTTPSIVNSNGTAAISVNVGTGGTASSGVLTFPAATTNWNCTIVNPLSGVGTLTQQSAHTSTSVTLTNYTIATDVAVAWTASYVLELNCVAK